MMRSRSDETRQTLTRILLIGIRLWTIFSVVAVTVRGVRWDDNYMYAQVNLGQIQYPDDHPISQCIRGVYSLQTHLLAAFMWAGAGPVLANGARNVIFLLVTVVPVFVTGTVLTRKPLSGHLAAVLCLLGLHTRFFSTYPVQTWPEVFSTGTSRPATPCWP